jgi:hypothetical protein
MVESIRSKLLNISLVKLRVRKVGAVGGCSSRVKIDRGGYAHPRVRRPALVPPHPEKKSITVGVATRSSMGSGIEE